MKKTIFILSIIIPLFAFTTINTVMFSGIINAFKAGDATQLSTYFDSKVEISVLDKEDVYSKTEAEGVINKFFSANKPTAFSKEHEGTSPSGANYCIGILKTAKGPFRVFIHAKASGGKKIIQQIQIEEE